MAPETADPTTRVLREREAQTLLVLLVVVGATFVFESVKFAIEVAGQPGRRGVLPVALYLVVSLAMCGGLIVLLQRRRAIGRIGIAVALLGATFPVFITIALWRGYAAELPFSLLIKSPIATTGLAAVAGMTLTLRPAYVVIAGIGAALTLCGFFAVAWLDPTVALAQMGGESYLTPAVSTIRLSGELLLVAGGTAAAAFATHIARKTVREAVTLQRSTDQLSRYFSPGVASSIREGSEAFLRPGGREQEVVVLFSDLAGFTRMSAGLSANETLGQLTEYQERMVNEIFKVSGTLDKFIGDGIMATFGTPEPAADAADRAVQAAQGMMLALADLNRVRATRGLPPLVQRIGIHAGRAAVGNVGTPQRLEFTVIGETVNLANRLQAVCKKTCRAAMISDAVVQRLSGLPAMEPLGPIRLDGHPRAVEVYALK